MTYAELERGAASLARRLAAMGVSRGDRVATTLPAGADFARLLHALPKLGAAIVPLNPRLTPPERTAQLEAAGARVVVDRAPTGPEADVRLATSVEPDDVQTVLFTSGTSGRPKTVCLSYANHRASALASAWNLGVAPGDRWLCALPVFHVGGISILLRAAIYGTAAVLHERFEEHAVRTDLESGRATLVSLVPTMLRRLIEAGVSGAPRLRAALIGGAPAPRALLERALGLGIPVLQTYGMTETASQIATVPLEDALSSSGAAGRALPGVELRIGPDREILVRGPMVARGALATDGWLHTGDLGSLDRDELLRVDGRLGDLIITGGENVHATEVEAALSSHAAVADAGVVGRPDPEWGEAVAAYVVRAGPVDAPALIAHCRTLLASHKLPKRIEFVDALPRSPTGKLLRGRLKTL